MNRFDDLLKKAEESNNINEIIAIPQESEVIKGRCFQEINKKIKEIEKKKEKDDPTIVSETTKKEPKEKEIENISLNNLFKTTKNIETEDDIEEVLSEIREKLKKVLEEDKNIKLI